MKKLIILIVISFFGLAGYAQKLPNVQQGSLRAPANIKIDGIPTEWDNHFQGYNHATEVFYTLSNDDNNLYLAIQTSDDDIINKIISGRISFTINKSGKKSDVDAITISYPIFNRNDKPGLNLKNKPEIIPGSAVSVKQADSFMYVSNKRMTDRAKWIKVEGIKTLDTLISAYNEDGIKAAALFNNKMAYTWEVAVALKVVGLSVNDATKFSYNIKLNPVQMDDMPGVNIVRAPNGAITSIDIHKDQMTPHSQMSNAATDFWGEYTLAKK
jgi:hypothetical protein